MVLVKESTELWENKVGVGYKVFIKILKNKYLSFLVISIYVDVKDIYKVV